MSAGVARAGREPVVTARGVASAGLRDFDFADGSGGAAMKFSVSFASVALLILVLPLMWVRPGAAQWCAVQQFTIAHQDDLPDVHHY
jgi:hypothetical protein